MFNADSTKEPTPIILFLQDQEYLTFYPGVIRRSCDQHHATPRLESTTHRVSYSLTGDWLTLLMGLIATLVKLWGSNAPYDLLMYECERVRHISSW